MHIFQVQDNNFNSFTKTKEIFEPLYSRELNNQEIFSIKQNLVGFFQTLIDIDEELKQDESNELNNRSTNTTN